jgi:hypothetical protein
LFASLWLAHPLFLQPLPDHPVEHLHGPEYLTEELLGKRCEKMFCRSLLSIALVLLCLVCACFRSCFVVRGAKDVPLSLQVYHISIEFLPSEHRRLCQAARDCPELVPTRIALVRYMFALVCPSSFRSSFPTSASLCMLRF